jgi:hypothetical protein
MNAEQKELLDLAILRVMDANRTRFGLGIKGLAAGMLIYSWTKANFAGDEEAFHSAIADRLQYLCDHGLAEEVLKGVNKGNRAWRISTAGIDHVDERG